MGSMTVRTLAGAVAAAALLVFASSAQAAACAGSAHPGGEWRGLGGNYSNTRSQAQEKTIGLTDAPTLSPVWTLTAEGDITGTPTVVDGCMYAGSSKGWVYAVNADTGELVWKQQLPEGAINASVAADSGTLFVDVSRVGSPYMAALDQATGDLLWTTTLDTQPGADVYATPVIFDGVVMSGVSGGSAELGDEADRYAFQGSMSFLDATTGELLKKTWTIHPPHTPEDNFAGATIWSTPAIDPELKVAFVGAGNPFRPQEEAEHANSVLKFDIDRTSPAFGTILDSYKGTVDEYFPQATDSGVCQDIPGNPAPYYPQGLGQCGDLDMDFGASPNLFTGADGRKLVGAGQKSGVYHVFDAKTMEPVWKQIVGPPSSVGGIVGSTAYDGTSVFGPITIGGYLWSIGAADGAYRWFAPIGDGAHWGNPVSVANGLAYTVDLHGTLDVYDTATGALVGKHPMAVGGTKTPLSVSFGGVSIARNTVYASVGTLGLATGYVVAFRNGSAADKADDVIQTLGMGDPPPPPGGGDLPDADGTVVSGPGAANYGGYLTPAAVTTVGGGLSYTNLDIARHDVVADTKGADGQPLFRSELAALGETVPVTGLDRVEAGKTYGFHCSLHPGMKATLVVR